jgi:hypothetical protein
MTGQEAQRILQKPIFGSEQCIQARDVLRIVAARYEENGGSLKELLEVDLDARYCRQFSPGEEE